MAGRGAEPVRRRPGLGAEPAHRSAGQFRSGRAGAAGLAAAAHPAAGRRAAGADAPGCARAGERRAGQRHGRGARRDGGWRDSLRKGRPRHYSPGAAAGGADRRRGADRPHPGGARRHPVALPTRRLCADRGEGDPGPRRRAAVRRHRGPHRRGQAGRRHRPGGRPGAAVPGPSDRYAADQRRQSGALAAAGAGHPRHLPARRAAAIDHRAGRADPGGRGQPRRLLGPGHRRQPRLQPDRPGAGAGGAGRQQLHVIGREDRNLAVRRGARHPAFRAGNQRVLRRRLGAQDPAVCRIGHRRPDRATGRRGLSRRDHDGRPRRAVSADPRAPADAEPGRLFRHSAIRDRHRRPARQPGQPAGAAYRRGLRAAGFYGPAAIAPR